jgi:hypothetical protein
MYNKKYPLYGVVCVWVRFICGSAGSGLADRSGTDCMSDGDGYSGGAGGAGSESHAAAAAVSAAAAASEALVTAQLTAHSNLARCLLKLGRPAAAGNHLDMAIGLSGVVRRGEGPDDLMAAQKALCTSIVALLFMQ